MPERFDTVSRSPEEAMGRLATGCLLAPFRALALMIGLLFSSFRGLIPMGFGKAPHRQLDPVQVPVMPFRLQTDDGAVIQCTMRGELRGGSLSLGDRIEVRGRLSPRTKVLHVAMIKDLGTGATVRPHLPPGAGKPINRWPTVFVVVLVILFLLVLL